jgi:hypothetical protein
LPRDRERSTLGSRAYGFSTRLKVITTLPVGLPLWPTISQPWNGARISSRDRYDTPVPRPRVYASNAERQRAYRRRRRTREWAEHMTMFRASGRGDLADAAERGDAWAWGFIGKLRREALERLREQEREEWPREHGSAEPPQ